MNVVILIRSIMPRGCVTTAIINLEEIRSPGYAVTKNYMHRDYAKIAILINITRNEELMRK